MSSGPGEDLHSFWLITLVELGIIGLFYYVYIYAYILQNCFKKLNIYTKSLFCSLIGLMTASIFHNSFASFAVQLFIIIFFYAGIRDYETTLNEFNNEDLKLV